MGAGAAAEHALEEGAESPRFPRGTPSAASGTCATPRRSRARCSARRETSASFERDHGILRAVRHEDRRRRVGRARFRFERILERQIGRERHDAGDALGMAQPRLQRDRAALREPREHDARRGNAAFDSRARSARSTAACDSRMPRLVGHARDVASCADVVPRAHHEAVVDRDRPHRRVREDEAQRRARRAAAARARCGTKSQPSAPRPCSQMTVARGLGAGARARCVAEGLSQVRSVLGGRIADFGRNAFTTSSRVSM